MRSCDATAAFGSVLVCCSLPIGHGGVHALRKSEERKESTRVGEEVRLDAPTTVYETVCTWQTGQAARPHTVQR